MPKVTLTAAGILLLAPFGLSQAAPESPKITAVNAAKKKPATEKAIDRQEAARKQQALDLIKRSYAWNQQVDGEDRVSLLNGQIMVVSQLDKELARSWARELFDLGANGQVRYAQSAQVMAINSLSMNDPEGALTLLAQIDPATLTPDDREFPGRNIVARMPRDLFNALVRKNGKSAMPKISATADALGEKGRYPYTGVMAAALWTKDEPLIESTLRKLLARFQQGLDPAFVGFDFAEMLSESERFWPKELLKPAIEAAVAGVGKYPVTDANKKYGLVSQTAGGSASTAKGPVEMGLLQIAPLINRVDLELWTQLTKTYPSLSNVAAEGDGSQVVSTTMYLNNDSLGNTPSAEEQKMETVSEMYRLSTGDPEKAIKAISAISDAASRVEAYSSAAKYWGDKDPTLSARFAAAAEKASSKVEDIEVQFKSACARLYSDAANKDRSAMAEDMERAFQLGDKVLRQSHDEGEGTGDLIGPLLEAVTQTMKIEPDMTVAHIEFIFLPYQKAELLTEAASVLAGSSEPAQSAPPPKTE